MTKKDSSKCITETKPCLIDASNSSRSSDTQSTALLRLRQQTYLRPTNVFVRIRPLAESGGHASDPSGDVAKALETWGDNSVTISTQYLFSKGKAEYTFPKCVLGPEVNQQEAFDKMGIQNLVDQFCSCPGRNVMMFAYGQTGAGKTHTILGTDESLIVPPESQLQSSIDDSLSEDRFKEWGVFPRIYRATETAMRKSGRTFLISASAVEFYLGGCSDLLQPDNSSVWIDPDTHEPVGGTSQALQDTNDLLKFLALVQKNRTTRSTRMNQADQDQHHGGSSRSHAAFILRLQQCKVNNENGNNDTDHYCETSFTLIDLAGAERPSKTREKRYGGGEAVFWMMQQGQELPTGVQALIINYELSAIATEVLRATKAYRKKRNKRTISPDNWQYAPPKQLATQVIKFIGGCFDGSCIASMCLCLSSANVNGWETWYSLQYGQSVSQLQIPIREQPTQDLNRAYKVAEREAKKAADEFAKAPKNKYYEHRRLRAVASRQRFERILKLRNELMRENS